MRLLAVAVEGRGLVDPAEPVFRADDEALLRGSAAFETVRVYAGRPFRLGAHLERLAASAARLGLPPVPDGAEELARVVVDAAGGSDLALRVYRTGLEVVATAAALPEGLEELRTRGLRVRSEDLEKFIQPAAPTGFRLPYRWPPTPEDIERRGKIIDAMLAARAKMKPLGMTTAELIREARREREILYGRE